MGWLIIIRIEFPSRSSYFIQERSAVVRTVRRCVQLSKRNFVLARNLARTTSSSREPVVGAQLKSLKMLFDSFGMFRSRRAPHTSSPLEFDFRFRGEGVGEFMWTCSWAISFRKRFFACLHVRRMEISLFPREAFRSVAFSINKHQRWRGGGEKISATSPAKFSLYLFCDIEARKKRRAISHFTTLSSCLEWRRNSLNGYFCLSILRSLCKVWYLGNSPHVFAAR